MMLYGYTKEEIQMIVDAVNDGKTFSEVMDELNPKSQLQCLYECAEESRKSFSLIRTIYNLITKKAQSEPAPSWDCAVCIDCLA